MKSCVLVALFAGAACNGGEIVLPDSHITHIAIGAKASALQVLSLNTETMAFISKQEADISDVNYLRVTPQGNVLALQPSKLNLLARGSLVSDDIEYVSFTETKNAPTAVEMSSDGRIVFTAHFSDNAFSAHTLVKDSFSQAQNFNCGWAHQFRPHPNGKWAYGACMKNTLRQFSLEGQGFPVVPMSNSEVKIEGGPRHLEFHPDGRSLYVLLQISSQVAVYDINMSTGQLIEPPKQIINTTIDNSKNKSSDIHITPNGKWLYAFNRRDQNMAVFSVLPDNRLKFKKTIPMNKGEVRDWSMSSDGTYLITATDKGHVGVWSIDAVSGSLELQTESTGHGNAITVAILNP